MFTETQLKKLKAKEKIYQVSCGDGLSLAIDPDGRKYWKFFYTNAQGKRKVSRLGDYPNVNLRDAKNERLKVLKALDNEIEESKKTNFLKVSSEWLSFKEKSSLGDRPLRGVLEMAEIFINQELVPSLGNIEIRKIKRTDLVKLIRKIESRGVKEPCKKACSYLNQLFEFAVSIGYVEDNIASNLNKILVKTKMKENYAYLNKYDIIQFYNDINKSNSHPIVKKALRIKTLTGVRGAELINAKKENIDLENGLWNIPAIQVKQFRRKVIEGQKIPDYIIPLSKEAVELMESAMEWSRGSEYVFNSPFYANKPLHFNTLNNAIRAMGYQKGELTAHGLRSSMSTILNESDLFKSEWIEAQLSHTDKNAVRGTYNHADYLDKRAKMMQWWSDYLNKKVVLE